MMVIYLILGNQSYKRSTLITAVTKISKRREFSEMAAQYTYSMLFLDGSLSEFSAKIEKGKKKLTKSEYYNYYN